MDQPILAQLKKFAPNAKTDYLQAIIDGWEHAVAARIDTPLRFQHFMAQIAHESSGFTSLSENMRYSGKRLSEVFKTRNGLTPQRAGSLARQGPEAIANFVYGGEWGRKNLGNTQEGDGWLFRGGGFMQTTGRANYTARGKALGMSAEQLAEAVREPGPAFAVACKEWEVRKCNEAADRDDVAGVTKKINGGTNGLADRKEWLQKAKATFKDISKPKVVSGGLADRMDREQVARIQRQLDTLGYHEVGEADGLWGPRTRGALSTFQLDQSPPLPQTTGELDRDTMDALFVIARPRPIDVARRTANSAVVAASAPGVIQPNLVGRFRAGVAAVGSGILAAGTGALSYLREGYEYVNDIRESIPVWAWLTLLGAVCTYFWYNNKKGVEGAVESYRAGKVV